jgi:hypothetical protein
MISRRYALPIMLKGLILCHPLGRASVEFVLLAKPHEYWRWPDHTITYAKFKKEMWGKSCRSGSSTSVLAKWTPVLLLTKNTSPLTTARLPYFVFKLK